MAWEFTLLDASFRGVSFDVTNTSDEVSRDVQQHLYPYVDGADQEDLGCRARQISMTAVFTGRTYEIQLNAFINVLNEKGHGELVHPVFGVMPKMQVLNYRIDHDADNYDYATVNVTWVEHQASNPFFSLDLPAGLLDLVGLLSRNTLSNYLDLFIDTISNIRSLNFGVSNVGYAAAAIMSVFRSRVPGLITSYNNLQDSPKAYVTDVVAAYESLVAHKELIGDSLMANWRNLNSDINSIINLPKQYASGLLSLEIDALNIGGQEQSDSLPEFQTNVKQSGVSILETMLLVSAATVLADVVSDVFADQLELTNAYTNNQINNYEINQTTILTSNEVQQITIDYRSLIQRTLDVLRSVYGVEQSRDVCESLKTLAFNIQQTAAAVLESRPSLTRITVENDTNLHLLAHKLYADYKRADEILQLNSHVRHPNKVFAGAKLNVYNK
ncbi:DNA circularization protein [Oligella urethralis]|uniref:DNA circularization protein n=1 Tax=Oligella urethralis TaxID=90245 RepID=UPI00288B0C2F|nr:DNA circularization N-terminal domain-containing protein [Oligella urethralis]